MAWLRVAARAALLVLYGISLRWAPAATGVAPLTGVLINAASLPLAGALLLGFRRRPAQWLIHLGANLDLVLLAFSAFLAVTRPGSNPGFVLATMTLAMQLLLVFDALTMTRRAVMAFAAATWLIVLGLALGARLPPSDVGVTLLLLGLFGTAVSVAGARLVSLTARATAEAHARAVTRRHHDELAATHAALRTAQADAEALSALIIHDLRNPLASVHANLETLREELPAGDGSALEAADVALAELRRVTGMTQDLLLVGRLERRDWNAAAPTDVAGLLEAAAQALGPVVARSGARLSVSIADGAPGEAPLDAPLVRRVLDNLVMNAARHVGPGDEVQLAAEPDGAGLRLAVRNSGPPVPAGIRAQLFEKHSRGDRRWDGSGLGLYLCRLVAERHGGRVALVERPGWSVSFEATFPAR